MQLGIADLLQQRQRLIPRQHGRQAHRLLRPRDLVEPGQLDPQHFAIKKQQRRQRLALRGRGYVALHRQTGQKGLHISLAQLARVTLAMKENVAFNPADICRFGTQAVMLQPQAITHLIQQSGCFGGSISDFLSFSFIGH